MRTVLDSSVILEVVTDDPTWAESSEAALIRAIEQGGLVIGETVLAEITPAFESGELESFLKSWKIQFHPTTEEAAIRAGQMYAVYLSRGGTKERVIPDFLIGAHAMANGGRLLARDRGYYRDYFEGLHVIEPN